MFHGEEWKPIDFNPFYLISSFGRIYSLKTKKFMSAYMHQSRSAYYIRFNVAGKKKMSHILVAEHFHKEQKEILQKLYPNEKLQVDHIDGNTLNPNKNNTEWVTESENKKRSHLKRLAPFSNGASK